MDALQLLSVFFIGLFIFGMIIYLMVRTPTPAPPDLDLILLDDTDPTKLLLHLSVEHGFGVLTWDANQDQWVLNIADHVFTGQSQIETLLKAKVVLR